MITQGEKPRTTLEVARFLGATFAGLTLFALVSCCGNAHGAPPVVDFPTEIKAQGDFVTVRPRTDAKGITYVGLSGVDPFPSALLKDARDFVFPTRGLSAGSYRFSGVASLNDEHTEFRFTVLVGGSPGPGPNPGPAPNPPGPNPGPAPVVSYDAPVWVYLIEESSKRTPEMALMLQNVKFWNEMESKGYKFRPYDVDSPDVKKRGLDSIKDKEGKALAVPYLVVADKDGGVIGAYPCPKSTAGVVPLLPPVKSAAARLLFTGDDVLSSPVPRAEPPTVYLPEGCYIDGSGRTVCPQPATTRGGLGIWRR